VPNERINGLAAVLSAVRAGTGVTQPMLVEQVGLGRSVVAQRVSELEAGGLIESAGLGPSSGGRAPRRLRLAADRGRVLGVDIAATELVVGVADLTGTVLATRSRPIDVADGPERVLSLAEKLADELLGLSDSPPSDLSSAPSDGLSGSASGGPFGGPSSGASGGLSGVPSGGPVWAVGVGVPGPVEFRTGLPVVPPIMPGWDRYPIRDRLAARYRAPVWVDNDVNLMALGELRSDPSAAAAGHVLYVRAGIGIGAALVMDGKLYRGANGSAGDIGHVAIPEGGTIICRCGNLGCLEAVAGGAALAREGRMLAESGQSPALAAILAERHEIRPFDVTIAAEKGDHAARALLQRTSALLGGTLATLVSFYNPGLLVLGGGIAPAKAHVLASIREAIYRRALPLATQDLRIEVSTLPEEISGVTGAVHLALDEVFAPANLDLWLESGTPTTLAL
jgi:predicted NBD/HSP70 family sugar kinase